MVDTLSVIRRDHEGPHFQREARVHGESMVDTLLLYSGTMKVHNDLEGQRVWCPKGMVPFTTYGPVARGRLPLQLLDAGPGFGFRRGQRGPGISIIV